MDLEQAELIHNYLHEFYEYCDGELIARKNTKGKRAGERLGSFKIHPGGLGYYVGSFNINGKKYNKRISHLIYIYHYKVEPQYIAHKDGNKLNCRIENLCLSRFRQNNTKPKKRMSGNIVIFKSEIEVNGEVFILGDYYNEDEAKKAIDLFKYTVDFCGKSLSEARDIVREQFNIKKYEEFVRGKKDLPEGVDISKNKFRARIRFKGERLNLGSFYTPDEAHQAYLNAKKRLRNEDA